MPPLVHQINFPDADTPSAIRHCNCHFGVPFLWVVRTRLNQTFTPEEHSSCVEPSRRENWRNSRSEKHISEVRTTRSALSSRPSEQAACISLRTIDSKMHFMPCWWKLLMQAPPLRLCAHGCVHVKSRQCKQAHVQFGVHNVTGDFSRT